MSPTGPHPSSVRAIGVSSGVVVRPWHTLSPHQVLEALGSDEDGLSHAEAQRRLAEYGPNALTVKARRPKWAVFLEQFKSPLILILLGAAAIAVFMDKGLDVWVILAVVLLNAVLGYMLEERAADALQALQKLTSPRARVLRDGHVDEVAASEVVMGDVLVLEPGDRVAADARILRASELAIAEAELTGESLPVAKTARALGPEEGAALGDRVDMAFMNTAVVSGRAYAVVVATGMATEMGRIARDVAESASETPVQRKLADFSRKLGLWIMIIIGAVLGMGVALGHPFADMFYVAISLAVAAIPEGLPIVMSVLFAVGVTRMARLHALVRRLPAVEGLGSATIICTDKTGTLTRNAMTIERVFVGDRALAVTGEGYAPQGTVSEGERVVTPGDRPGLAWLGACCRLCNDAVLEHAEGAWRVIGDPTEGALVVLAEKLGVKAPWERLQEIPFSSERKWMATLHRTESGELVAFAKGALERLLPMAAAWQDADGSLHPMDDAARSRYHAAAEAMASDALRTLALGMVRGVDHPDALSGDYLQGRLVMVGLVGMIDPPRPEAIHAIATCREAGVRVAMITGDHRATATAIARQIGLWRPEAEVLDGAAIERLTDAELESAVERTAVYARVSPAHKLRIVRALQRHGEVVAMTGDGVNDAPALSQADIGIAMGITGTEVAKNAADMVLADDNFATIVAAVREGRTISDNLRHVIGFLTATCVGNIATIAAAIALGLPLPLTAVMLLWINLVATGAFDKPLAMEQGDAAIMHEPPRSPREPLVTKREFVRLFAMGLSMALGTLAVFAWELAQGTPIAHARTEAFTINATFQAFSALAYRSDDRPIWALPSNPWMAAAAVLALGIHILAVYWGPLQLFLGTVAIAPWEFALAVAEGTSLLLFSELFKWARSRRAP